MNPLRITDNSLKSQEDFKHIPKLVDQIKDKTLDCLEKKGIFVFPTLADAEDLTKEQKILESVNSDYRTQNVMGFLGYGDGDNAERLVISSRFTKSDDKDGSKDYFLHYLLNKVFDFPNIFELHSGANSDLKFYALLEFIFPYYLKQALRKGLFKTYIRKAYNDSNVKGTIDFARHIKLNTPFIGKIAYSQREFTSDNLLMELVRHTVEFIKGKPYGRTILNKAKDEVRMVVESTPLYELCDRQKIIHLNKHKVIRHAFYREYKELQKLCILILTHQKMQVSADINRVCGVLFDGAWLWEEYINTLIEDKFFHPRNKGKSNNNGGQRLFKDDGGKIGLIYPDFIGKVAENRVIADAKYKPVGNIANKDYFQVLAYMFRFDAKTGFYFYPEADKNVKPLNLSLLEGCTLENNVSENRDPKISVTKLGLQIPQGCGSYEYFVKEIESSENNFKSIIVKSWEQEMGYQNDEIDISAI